ncbi:MAG: HAMP domain-containing histidine kinase [Clostridium sp.]|nr:HAMP domain-containing histidine kinase [Clostridium sp.]
MDTKLKNGNQDSEDKKRRGNGAKWTGIAIAFAAAALFTALMPEFHKKAQEHYETKGSGSIESEEFVSALILGNYGLYKEALDKSGSKTYSYEELYLDKELESDSGLDSNTPAKEQAEMKEYLLENATLKNASFLNEAQFQSVLEIYVNQMEEMAWEIQKSLLPDIEDSMDYYVLDKKTQTEIKNTTRPIENLLSAGNVEEKAHMEDIYEYYLIMDYDEAGNFQALGVKGQDADKLLKTLQTAERSQYGYLLSGRKAQETYAFYYEDTDNVEKLLTLRQKKPTDAVFIYAMTKEQMNIIKNWGYTAAYPSYNFGSVPLIYSYAQAGVISVYLLFLAAIFALVLFLALCMPRLLRGKRERKAPVEVIAAIAAFILFVVGSEVILAFVFSMENYGILEWLNENFPVTLSDGQEYEIIKNSVCFAFFAALFGVWYFCCLEFSDIVYGLKDYIQKRSLLYRAGAKVCGVGKKIYRKYKAEVLDVDLGKDMNELLRKLLFISFCLLATACLCWYFGIIGVLVYVMALYYFLKKYIHKMQEQYALLLEATNAIAEGHFQNDFEGDFGIFESYKEELYKVQDGFKKAVEEEVKSQRMKTELITNVSHDLKTPLTAIITYTDLLKEENITDEQRKEYVNTLERKALRLKILIEDLFEVSKTSSGSVNLEPVPVDICNLLRQVYLEHEDKMKQMGLQVRFTMPEEKIILDLDSQKTYRIFENLYVNILKYALPDTRVFIVARKIAREKSRQDGVHIELKNISAQEIIGNPEDLSERFVRGDASRNTEGSGLGLAIAKNLTQLQGGKFMIETDGDLFKVVIEW